MSKARFIIGTDAVDPAFGPFPTFRPNPASQLQDRWNRATAKMRDCVCCALPFYSTGAGNVVCVPCREASAAEFEGAL